jgi:hypothetical protein
MVQLDGHWTMDQFGTLVNAMEMTRNSLESASRILGNWWILDRTQKYNRLRGDQITSKFWAVSSK